MYFYEYITFLMPHLYSDYYQKTFEELLKIYESAINSFFEDEAKLIYNEISLLL